MLKIFVLSSLLGFLQCNKTNSTAASKKDEPKPETEKAAEMAGQIYSTEFQYNLNPTFLKQLGSLDKFWSSLDAKMNQSQINLKHKEPEVRYFFKTNYRIDGATGENQFIGIRMRTFPGDKKKDLDEHTLTLKFATPLLLDALSVKVDKSKWEEVKIEQDFRRSKTKITVSLNASPKKRLEMEEVKKYVMGSMDRLAPFSALRTTKEIEHSSRVKGVFAEADGEVVEINLDLSFETEKLAKDFVENPNFASLVDGELTFKTDSTQKAKNIALAKRLFLVLAAAPEYFVDDPNGELPGQLIAP
jgi:hypothetical protein